MYPTHYLIGETGTLFRTTKYLVEHTIVIGVIRWLCMIDNVIQFHLQFNYIVKLDYSIMPFYLGFSL